MDTTTPAYDDIKDINIIDEDDTKELEEVIVNNKLKRKINNSDDPEYLKTIIRSHYNHILSQLAIENNNCPKEILVEVLRRGKEDDMSYRAAKNKNCPVEELVELYIGKYEWLKCGVVMNPNCPIYILIEVLSKFEDTGMSRSAYINKRSPKYLKEEWYSRINVVKKHEEFLKV